MLLFPRATINPSRVRILHNHDNASIILPSVGVSFIVTALIAKTLPVTRHARIHNVLPWDMVHSMLVGT